MQEMNLEQLNKDETWICRTCKQRFSEIGWNSHSLISPLHNAVDVFKISSGELLWSQGPGGAKIQPHPGLNLTPADSDEEMEPVYDVEEDDK